MSSIVTQSREIDVFETEGGVTNASNFEDDRESDSVEKIEAGFQDSYSKFKKSQLQPGRANFSDSVSRPSMHYGYKAELDDYELEGTRTSNETLIQRYQRLKLEVSELINEVDQVEKSKTELSGANPADVISDLQQLQHNLGQLELDRVLMESSALAGSGSVPHAVLFKQLQTQVAAAKKPSTDEAPPTSGPVYEVYANVEAAKFGHLSKLSELEKRLSTLEGLVGKNDSKVSAVAAGLDADYKDISSAILGLQSKVALLDGSHVAAIIGQLNELLASLQKVKDQSKSNDSNKDDSEHKTKVSEALETASSIAPFLTVIPDVVNRLHSLKDLHEHASQLVNTVASVSSEQERISDQLSTLKSLLEQVQSSVSTSVETLQSNFETLQTKINSSS